MNESGERARRLWLGFWNGPGGIENPQAASIREEETALCLDCKVFFSIRNRACPKCGGEQFWLIAHWKREPRPPRVNARARARTALAGA
jgi:hypothetical protein